jgi:hypothetical protein
MGRGIGPAAEIARPTDVTRLPPFRTARSFSLCPSCPSHGSGFGRVPQPWPGAGPSSLAWACSLHSPGHRSGGRPGRAQRTSATSPWPRRMRQSSMRGPAATAHHRATGSARRPSKILSPPHNFARSLGQQKLVAPARLGSRCASGSRNSMPRGVLARRGGERGPRVPVSSYSTPMLGRPCPTSSPSGRPRRGCRGAGLSPEPVEGSPPPVSTPSSTHP